MWKHLNIEGAFNQKKALVGTFSVIVKILGTFGKPSFEALMQMLQCCAGPRTQDCELGEQQFLPCSRSRSFVSWSVPRVGRHDPSPPKNTPFGFDANFIRSNAGNVFAKRYVL